MSQLLEQGDLSLFYRPALGVEDPDGLYDVAGFQMVLQAWDAPVARLITVGKKRLPEPEPGEGQGERLWAYVQAVAEDPSALGERLGPETVADSSGVERHRPAARPAGVGRYALVRRGRHTELVYALRRPEEAGEVQQVLNIAEEGRLLLAVKNPRASSPPDVGLSEERQADYPAELQRRFDGRRWVEAEPTQLLDHAGTELLLIGLPPGEPDQAVTADGIEPAMAEPTAAEDQAGQEGRDVFALLGLDRDAHPQAPLVEGRWA